jgi:hypothetical protein
LLPLLSATVFADEALNQEEPPRGTPTSHTNKHMSMFGIQGDGQYSTWETWTNAGQDSDTDESFSENNIPGQANSGGGKRTFTFTGSAPYPGVVRLDKGALFSGDFTLSIDCPESQTCTKDVRIDIMYGQSVIGSVNLGPSEGTTNFYEYNVSHNLDEIEENEFSLNVPRYVDTSIPEKPIDVSKTIEKINELKVNKIHKVFGTHAIFQKKITEFLYRNIMGQSKLNSFSLYRRSENISSVSTLC